MKVTYLLLQNVAGIYVGMNTDTLEIDFSKSKNKIIAIIAGNGSGKTTLLSSISPFSSTNSLDDRNGYPYIRKGFDGYKEIHYTHDGDNYIIKHYFKVNKNTHSIKSYFQKNSLELNENGNVTSFLSLVEEHFGITPSMMRLIRIGSNVKSIIGLKSSERKNYVGNLIEEIEGYLILYKKVSQDIRTVKVLLSSNTSSINKLGIYDINELSDNLKTINKKIREYEKISREFETKIIEIGKLERENNKSELVARLKEAESFLYELDKMKRELESKGLLEISFDDLIKDRDTAVNKRISVMSDMKSSQLMIDSNLLKIDKLKLQMTKSDTDYNIQSIESLVRDLRNSVGSVDNVVKSFPGSPCSRDDLNYIISVLKSLNNTGNVIYGFDNKVINLYIKLRRDNIDIRTFIAEQSKKRLSMINDMELKRVISTLFKTDSILSPQCEPDQFNECPYFKLSNIVNDYKNNNDADVLDDESLRYLQVISNNVDNIITEALKLLRINIPKGFTDILSENVILSKISNKELIFDTSNLEMYLSLVSSHEVYLSNKERLIIYETQLKNYETSGVKFIEDEIASLQDSISELRRNIEEHTKSINAINKSISDIELRMGLVSKFNDDSKYKKVMQKTYDDVVKILKPLESSTEERIRLEVLLDNNNKLLSSSRNEATLIDNKINEYKSLVESGEKLNVKLNKLNIVSKALSNKEGIPVKYMNKYLNKIRNLANDLLDIIYRGDLFLGKFIITEDEFDIPYVKNGTKISDAIIASQSEQSLITMALSFALSYEATGNYNIPTIDESDAGLDNNNKISFLRMLMKQMEILKAEQVFMISQSIDQISNMEIDVIKLSESDTNCKLHNIIYE